MLNLQPQFGVDIAARRADDLDRALLAAVAARVARGQQPTVLDLGCGSGGLAARAAMAGARVSAVDVVDYQPDITARNQILSAGAPPIVFTWASAESYVAELSHKYDFVVLQRVLHYLAPASAMVVLRQLSKHCDELYISVTGLESDIGRFHPAAQQPLATRCAPLPAAAQSTFSITASLCPYTNNEFCSLLLATGLDIKKAWTSAFGNHKAIARPLN